MNPLVIIGGLVLSFGAWLFFRDSDDEQGELAPPKKDTPKAPQPPPNAVKALDLAPRVASDIFERGRNYSRDMLAAFQAAAGIAADGLYGGQSAGALMFWLEQSGSPLIAPPEPIFGAKAIQPYTPPVPIDTPRISGPLRVIVEHEDYEDGFDDDFGM